jgi:hypothetical protein
VHHRIAKEAAILDQTPWREPPDNRQPDNRAAKRGLLVVVVLLVIGFFLVKVLSRESRIEDCLLAHGRNCDALVK